MDQAPVQIGQFILGKNLGIGAFGKVSCTEHTNDIPMVTLQKILVVGQLHFSRCHVL
jgi:hypothetical protein